MMPISALPPLPMPLPVLPAAPMVLDFTTLLQGGEIAAPVLVPAEEEAQPVQTVSPDLDAPAPQAAPPLPAPPPILAMFQPPVPTAPSVPEARLEPVAVSATMPMIQSPPPVAPAKAMAPVTPTREDVAEEPVARETVTPAIEPAPMRAQVALSIQPDAPRAHELPILSASAPTATPTPPVFPTMLEASSERPLAEPEVIAVEPTKPQLVTSPDKPAPPLQPSAIIAAPAPDTAVEASQPQPVQRTQPVPAMAPAPVPMPALAPAALPIQPDAPRPARAAPAQPPLLASAPTVEPTPSASPTMREVPSSPPPVEVQALVADAATPEPPAAPDQPVAPLPQLQPAAAAPAQRNDALQPLVDTTDPRWIERMAQEIAEIADGDGRTRFRLNPETLGSMEVTVRHTPDGISVRFEVESESTRTLLAHAEQRLQVEARANGLRIADAQVDLADRGQREGRERPSEQPLIAIRTGQPADSTPSAECTPASARYA